jgi:hypothetical protein
MYRMVVEEIKWTGVVASSGVITDSDKTKNMQRKTPFM